ncbi:MAG: bifunctional precorrin-2 dehydrogenase/sirohydrochlorin ferrochelatase [Lachnospiraceae bacterium]|nr:bifunctional precorrin-2 dehydrogenase/sirohydrochlorin ferrochelatase [Lachnospiraceae bacterium]
MTLFPFFIDISNQIGMITGGGTYALEKIQKLRSYGVKLIVIATEFLPEIEKIAKESDRLQIENKDIQENIQIKNSQNKQVVYLSEDEEKINIKKTNPQKQFSEIHLLKKSFSESDLERNPFFVIIAGEDKNENQRIYELCCKKRILVNTVDDMEHCQFVFPSLIQKGNLSIGISTNGASPSMTIQLKKQIEELIPDNTEEILDWLQEKRPYIKNVISDKKMRFVFFRILTDICMEKNGILEEWELKKMIEIFIGTKCK